MAEYRIKSGDTLSEIAAANNTTVDELLKRNKYITDPNKIYADKTLILPDKTVDNGLAKKAILEKSIPNSTISELDGLANIVANRPTISNNDNSFLANIVGDKSKPVSVSKAAEQVAAAIPEEVPFINMLKTQENHRKVGYNADTNRWHPHSSREGGTQTVGYGHKLSENEAKSGKIKIGNKTYSIENGLSNDAINALLKQDLKAAEGRAKSTLSDKEWDNLSKKKQLLLTELAYNIGSLYNKDGKTLRYPTLTKYLKDKNATDEDILSEIGRGYYKNNWLGGKTFVPLTNRTNAIKDWYNNNLNNTIGIKG